MINKQFWKGRKVFITGHTGFKGSWLSIWLSLLGSDVTGYSLDPPTKPNLFDESGISCLIQDIRGDLRIIDDLKATINRVSPEIVIHLAAQPIVRESYRDPIGTYLTNAIGTANLLEAVRDCQSVKVVLNVTTDKVYENREWIWGYREDESLGGYDPYSASKACSEIITSSYKRSFFNHDSRRTVGIATARAGNVIGGGDWAADRIIPDCIRAFNNGNKLSIRNPNSIRPWQHVLEPLSGYLVLCEKLYSDPAKYSSSWNFGPNDDDAKTVEWIVKRVMKSWLNAPGYIIDKGEHPHEANFLKLDCSKAKIILGWKPKWDISKAIEKVVEWNIAYNSNRPCFEICKEQINAYEKA